MPAFNDEYNEEIIKIVLENPKAYGKMLKSKGFMNRYKDRTYLSRYITQVTPLLDDLDFKYSFKTRVFWAVNKIDSWDNPLVTCRACGKPIKRWNVVKFKTGYKSSCCYACERKIASETNKITCFKKYGVKIH